MHACTLKLRVDLASHSNICETPGILTLKAQFVPKGIIYGAWRRAIGLIPFDLK